MSQESQTQPTQSAHSAAMTANILASQIKKTAPKAYKSNIPSMRYIFKAGKVANFLCGRYVTDVAFEIAELDHEVACGHPNITESTDVAVEVIEPLEALKRRHFEEFQKQLEASVAKTNNAGNSEQTKLNVVNSNTIADAAAGSDSGMAPAAPTGGMKINVSLPKA